MKYSDQTQRPPELVNPHGEFLQEILGVQVGGIQSHSLAEVRIPPGGSSSCHFHKQSEESYLILSGQAKLVVDQQARLLKKGDAVLIVPPEMHQISNPFEEDLVFLAVCVPAWQPGDSFEAEGANS